VCPVALRGYLTCYVNCCWGIGQLIGIGVIKGNLWRTDEWAYRIPYALQVSRIGTTDLGSDWVVASIVDAPQWMWPLPIFIGVAFAPESPWWLVRKGRIEEARRSLLRLTSLDRETDFDPDETVDMMRHTTELEQEITTGASYLDCFRGVNLRRTEIVCMVWAMQNLSGNSFSNYSTYFLEQAGLDQSTSYNFAMGQYAINCVGVFGAWALMAWGMGRRTLFLTGLCGLCAALFVMGFLGLVPAAHKQTASLVTGIMMIVWALFYQLSVG
jgi:SP family general alpha glucoside:H+ symporter-like MFS transporter